MADFSTSKPRGAASSEAGQASAVEPTAAFHVEAAPAEPPSTPLPPGEATVISARPAAPGKPATMAEIGRLLEGRSLGPYRLDQFVGGGGMGAVFRALDTTLDRVVAVKVLSRQQSDDEETLRRFRNEAQSAARLDHENIGRVHAVGSDDGWHYIVFEFIEGTNLRDVVVKEGTFSLSRTIEVTVQVAEALEHASEREVVHRDIKPSNIIITPAGRARVVDMGLARLHHMGGDQDLTVSGMTLGTFDYISPEQARDPRSADVRSDLYSLGCTVFFMLVGRPPFADGTMVQKLLQHQQDPPPAIESLRPDIPKRFAAILGRLMEKDPKDRYQRPAELIDDLLGLADDLGLELATPRTAPAVAVEPVPRPVPVHLPWLLPLLGLVAVVGGLWLRTSSMPRPSDRGATGPGLPVAGTGEEAKGGDSEASGDGAAAESESRVWRVVDVPTVDDDCSTVAEAVRQASDGDVIEVACAEPRDDGPLTIEGKRLTIRAAPSIEPILRFAESGTVPRDGGCITVVSGTLDLRNVTLRSAFLPASPARPALVSLQGTAALLCETVLFVVSGEAAGGGAGIRSQTSGNDRQEIHAVDTRAEGGAVFLEAKGSGRIDLFW
ncbi:MAG: serine/threonine-protein kinase, partial [Planctomycetia bacterium]